MTIVTKTISGLVSDEVATWSAQTGTSPVFTSGDPLLAFFQSVAVQLDFLQAQIQIVLGLARAQTSTGADLDTWMAQFNFVRLGPNYATGPESFIRLTPASQPVVVPVGAIVQTVGGGVQYAVVGDPDEPTWSPSANGYVLAAGQLSLTATVEALIGGSASNVLANTLTQFGSSVPGIDQVTNPSPITNGEDAELDAAFRSRFILYLATLAKATRSAILAAAMGVQQGLLINLLENQQPNRSGGTSPLLGSFTVVVDDGSGDPPASLLNAVFNAVDATRAFSVEPFVTQPSQLQVGIALAVRLGTLPTGTLAASVYVSVQNGIAAMVNGLGPGVTLTGSAVLQTALSVSGVASVLPSSVSLNGAAADLVPSVQQEVRTTTGLIAVTWS